MSSLSYRIEEIDKAARWLIKESNGRNIISFTGDMGAGKTTLITAICKALGVRDDVSSPTFSIVNEYESERGIIYHFDFYRLRTVQEAYDFGYEEYFSSDALCLIEWPEKIPGLLPPETLKVTISIIDETSRRLSIA